jgi:hypothetical protein
VKERERDEEEREEKKISYVLAKLSLSYPVGMINSARTHHASQTRRKEKEKEQEQKNKFVCGSKQCQVKTSETVLSSYLQLHK